MPSPSPENTWKLMGKLLCAFEDLCEGKDLRPHSTLNVNIQPKGIKGSCQKKMFYKTMCTPSSNLPL